MANEISICAVMPNYNDGDKLKNSLSALVNQTQPFDSIIVINDGSTDDSLQIIEEIRKDNPNISVINNEANLGIIKSVNKGLEASSEDYVFLASANDSFSSHIVDQAKQLLNNIDKKCGIIAGKAELFFEKTGQLRTMELSGEERPIYYSPDQYRALLSKRNFSFYGGSVLVNRKMALEAGGFKEEIKWHSDWFLFSLLSNRCGFAYVPEVFGYMNVSENQYSSSIYNWQKQSEVIRNYILLLQQEYPDDYQQFKKSALLPSYDLQALPMMALSPTLRDYLTPLLVWRLLFYKCARVFGRIIPCAAREKLRKIARV